MRILFFKKIILAVIIVSLVSSSLGNVFTPKALAQGPATPGEAVGGAIAKGAACFLATKLESFAAGLVSRVIARGEDALNMALNPLGVPASVVAGGSAGAGMSVETSNALTQSKNCIRDVVVKMILDWIVDETIGWIQGEGQPRYVTNWETFLEDAFNVGVGEIISESNLKFLCKPFGLQVRLSLLPVPRFKNRIECTLDDIIANIDDFYNDFRSGGWIAYDSLYETQNNFWGVALQTSIDGLIEGEKQKEAAEKKAVTGQGFLPVEKCIKYDPNDPKKCLEYEIITPAPVVGHLTTRAAAADYDWAMSVHSWVAALTNAVINRIIKEGIGLMKKSTAPKSAGYGDYDPYAGYDPALSLKRQERDRIRGEYQNYLAYFEAILTNKKSSLSSVEQLVVNLNELKKRNCQPSVSDADIASAQNEVTRLTGEVASYQAIVNEINANIAEANNISDNFRDREMTLLTQKYSDFLVKYQSYITEIASGSETTKKSSLEESQNKQNELSSAQSRLILCIATQTP